MGLLDRVRRIFSRKKDTPIHALVLLRSRPQVLDSESIERVLERALGISFSHKDDENPEPPFVIGFPPTFMVQLADVMLLVNCMPMPYVSHPEKIANQIPELRLRKAVAEHAAWTSVDLMGDYDPDTMREGYRKLGKIIAELVDDDCVALYSTARNQLLPINEDVLEGIREDDPLQIFSQIVQPPVVNISGDDPRMVAAVEEARRRWPEFVAAYAARDGENFAIKAPVTDGRNTEFIWIEVAEIDGENIAGDLANDPVDLQFMKFGSRVRTTLSDLNDWAYIKDGDLIGGFTVQVLQEAHSGR